MRHSNYLERRDELTTYFDQTAAAAWQALTSNAPVSRIRATVRDGRDAMRATLLDWLPNDLSGKTLLDAGCGTGALAIDAARRGADVIAIDVAASLVDVARERAEKVDFAGTIDFRVGDMLTHAPAQVDYAVAMDSLIHYEAHDVEVAVMDLCRRSERKVLFTIAPWTPALAAMHFVGRLIPRSEDRAPAIQPTRVSKLVQSLDRHGAESGWSTAETRRIKNGFYISQAVQLTR